MENRILILSKCIGKKKDKNNQEFIWSFNFKGYYKGHHISMIRLVNSTDLPIEADKDYLVWCQEIEVSKDQLFVSYIKLKNLR